MALDVLGGDDPLFMGMIGMYGNRWTNTLMTEADVVVALGTRLDFGTIGADVGAWGRGRRIFQVDCDAAEMKRLRGARTLQSDLGEFLDSALRRLGARTVLPKPSWAEHVSELRSRWPDTDELGGAPGINPNVLFNRASHWLSGSAATVVDAGQHLWWACQSYRPAAGQRFLPALGLGPCGWALPAAIGIASDVGRPVNLIAGDGAVQLNLQELQTLVRDQLPVRMIIVDNGAHGSVRQLQEAAFGGRYPTTVIGYSAPDFARVAQAYGIPARVLDDPGDIEDGLRWLRDAPDGPALLHVKIATELNVYPNVPFGRSLSEMEVLGSGVQPSH
jgi:acetolactate synthase-1/2/3 large subunit